MVRRTTIFLLLIVGSAMACLSTTSARKTDFVAGLVLYKNVGGKIEYILLQKAGEPDDWSPPKGKVDTGEYDTEAAKREVFEETAYTENDYTAFFDKRIYFEYQTKKGITKKVSLFPAKLNNLQKSITLDPNEHTAFQWNDFTTSKDIIKEQYEDAFIKANDFIVAQESVD